MWGYQKTAPVTERQLDWHDITILLGDMITMISHSACSYLLSIYYKVSGLQEVNKASIENSKNNSLQKIIQKKYLQYM